MILGLNLYASHRAVRFIEQQAMERNAFTLAQYMSEIDRVVRGLDSISLELRYDLSLSTYLQLADPFQKTNVIRTIEMQEELILHNPVLDYVVDYLIYFHRLGVIISPIGVLSPKDYYDTILKEPERGFDDWSSFVAGASDLPAVFPTVDVIFRNSYFRAVPYIGNLGEYRRDQATLLFYVKWDRLKPERQISSLGADSGLSVFDKHGALIVSYGESPPLGESVPGRRAADDVEGVLEPVSTIQDHWVTTVGFSPYNGWQYMLRQPRRNVVARVRSIAVAVYAFLLLSFLLGVMLSIMFAFRSGRPWIRLVQSLGAYVTRSEAASGNLYDLLQTEVAKLVANHTQLTTALEEQKLVARASVFARLLHGSYVASPEMASLLASVGLRLHGRHFSVVLVSLESAKHADAHGGRFEAGKLILRQLIHECISDAVFVYDYSESQLVFVFEGSQTQLGNYHRDRKRKIDELSALVEPHCAAAFYVGGVYSQIVDISYSLEEARAAMGPGAEPAPGRIVYFESTNATGASYRYSHAAELRLENAVRAGDVEALNSVVAQIRTENLQRRQLPLPMLRHLLYAVAGTYVRLLDETRDVAETGLAGRLSEMEVKIQNESGSETFNYLHSLLIELTKLFGDRRRDRHYELERRIKEHIHRHFSDPMLGVPAIASTVDMSESYISHFFKEHAGINVSTYIESVRMEHAIRLLKQAQIPIKQIVTLTGYNSLTSFSRAFRRANGISPAEFRRTVSHG